MKKHSLLLTATLALSATTLALPALAQSRIVPSPPETAIWPTPVFRLPTADSGVVMHYGDGPGDCDKLGARDVYVFVHGGKYYMTYDGAGPTGWLTCLAESSDGLHWDKKGALLKLGAPGEGDSASASYCSNRVG